MTHPITNEYLSDVIEFEGQRMRLVSVTAGTLADMAREIEKYRAMQITVYGWVIGKTGWHQFVGTPEEAEKLISSGVKVTTVYTVEDVSMKETPKVEQHSTMTPNGLSVAERVLHTLKGGALSGLESGDMHKFASDVEWLATAMLNNARADEINAARHREVANLVSQKFPAHGDGETVPREHDVITALRDAVFDFNWEAALKLINSKAALSLVEPTAFAPTWPGPEPVPLFALGDIVETIKGAKFWGQIIAFDNDFESPGCTVQAIHPDFTIKHVYPLKQLRIREYKGARVE